MDCGGNAFTLQKLMGHSTLKMTKHYCAIFDADIARNFDSFSPLAQISKPNEKIKRRMLSFIQNGQAVMEVPEVKLNVRDKGNAERSFPIGNRTVS